MKSFLSADSPLMVGLRRLWDYMGLNMCFFLCCLPVVTIGSAHSAMYTAIRAISRDEPWLKLYFSTFFHGFKRPTIAWLILLPLILVFAWNTVSIGGFNAEGSTVPLVISCVCLGLAMCMSSTVALLYSRFECTVGQLLRNGLLVVIAHPIRCVLCSALIWLPVAAAVLLPWLFLETLIYQILFYFSFASWFFQWMMRKPLARMAGEEMPGKKAEKNTEEAPQEDDEDEEAETEEA